MATKHYVDNKQLYAVIVDYKQKVKQAAEAGEPKPRLPNYVGECLWMIANRLSSKPNFARYSYREEMVGDGVENCLVYFDNFNPEKTSNPFAYFTQIIYYAFLRRIEKEKKQLYIKHKVMENSMIMHQLADYQDSDDGEARPQIGEYDNEQMFDFIRTFEEKLDKKRSAAQSKGLEKFLSEDEKPKTEE